MEASEIQEMTYLGVVQEVTLLVVYPEDPYTFPYIKKNNNHVYFSVALQHNITETAQYDEL